MDRSGLRAGGVEKVVICLASRRLRITTGVVVSCLFRVVGVLQLIFESAFMLWTSKSFHEAC